MPNSVLIVSFGYAALFSLMVGIGMLMGWPEPIIAAAVFGLGGSSFILAVLYGMSPVGTAFGVFAVSMTVTAAFLDPSLPRSALWIVGGVATAFSVWSLYCWVGRDD